MSAAKKKTATKAKKKTTQDESQVIKASFPEADVDLKKIAAHWANKSLSKDDKIAMYRDLVRIRRFEERSVRVYQQGKIGGFLHLYIGQEALAVGTFSLLGENDHVITAYRDHGHAIAAGMGMNELMAELTGKHTGCSKGKGGSMHFFAPDKHYWGGHGIVGGQTPLGAGIAYALKYKGLKGGCFCFMGDGAVNQGAVHESFNLAGLWDLPVIYVIENNGYSMGTSQARSSAGEPLARRAAGYEIDWSLCNGNVLYDVRAKLGDALKRAQEESRPSIVEIFTYRYRGHSMSDPDKTYRKKTEIEEYRKTKDPITLFENQLKDEGVLDDKAAEAIDKEARTEAENAANFADKSPFPPESSILEDVYWETDNPNAPESTSKGRFFFGNA